MIRPQQRKDLGNGVRPRPALGTNDPIWRLGALVSLPSSIGKVMMVKRPDRSLSPKPLSFMHCRENVFSFTPAPLGTSTKEGQGPEALQNQRNPSKRSIQRLKTQAIAARECMAADRTVKVLLATCPRALLRSTLTARSAA